MSEEEVEFLKVVRMCLRDITLGYGVGPNHAKNLCVRLSKMIGERYEFETGVSFPISDENECVVSEVTSPVLLDLDMMPF